MADIIGIGASVYDTLMLAAGFPQEDTKLQAMQTMVQGGGPCATALVAAARLGVRCEYMGTMGDDSYGRFMVRDFEKYGVGTGMIRICRDCVSFHSFVLLNTQAKTRTVVWNKGTVPAPMPVELDLNAIQSAKILHLDGNQMDAAVHAARFARKNGVTVSLDAGSPYPGIDQLLPFVDILIPSEEFAMKVTGKKNAEDAARQLMCMYQPRVLVVTQGSRGGIYMENGEIRRYPAYSVEVIDSCGAGDVFHGAFLAAWLQEGNTLEQCCRFASAVSAIKCTHFGAREGIPSLERTRAFLKERENGK